MYERTPNKDALRKWVKALRSKKYKQCSGNLRKGTLPGDFSYCCLGVATEVAIKEGVIKAWDYGDLHWQILPPEVADWLGVEHDPKITDQPLREWKDDTEGGFSAVSANDDFNLSFRQIANRVEKYYGLKETANA